MKIHSLFLVWLLGLVLLTLLEVDAKSCRGLKGAERKECLRKGKKAARQLKGKNRRKAKKDVAPYWRRKPPESEVIVRQGSQVTLTCAMRASPNPTFQWKQHNKLLSKKVDYPRLSFRRIRLHIKGVREEDMGNYSCIAKNKFGKLEFNFTLRVLGNMPMMEINLVDRPENQTSLVGDTVIFQCKSSDWPQPTVYWARKVKDVEEMLPKQKNASNANVLVLHNVTKADSGEYRCIIGNELKHETLSATLKVIEESEKLPFEPACSLHVRRQVLIDHKQDCKTSEPVEIHYCMGSCGRSYYVPVMMTSDIAIPRKGFDLNQTCSCCSGVAETLRIVDLECPLGQTKKGFYPLLTSCLCKPCKTEDFIDPNYINVY